ncbi:GNAT family N-acetyltransferase [Kribbella sp. HUAS MG21]|uniref:GNAT family N-acetyltransferase n=1 Tax=Kribbella sp. HUAS MG21 TaxID=3160966 RepID=UPI00330571B4
MRNGCPRAAITHDSANGADAIRHDSTQFAVGGGGTAEVGYWTAAPEARGRGVAPVAVRAVCGWAFEVRGLDLIEWRAESGTSPRAGWRRRPAS